VCSVQPRHPHSIVRDYVRSRFQSTSNDYNNNQESKNYDDKWIRTRAAVASQMIATVRLTGSLTENVTLDNLGDERLSIDSAQHNGFYFFERRHA